MCTFGGAQGTGASNRRSWFQSASGFRKIRWTFEAMLPAVFRLCLKLRGLAVPLATWHERSAKARCSNTLSETSNLDQIGVISEIH